MSVGLVAVCAPVDLGAVVLKAHPEYGVGVLNGVAIRMSILYLLLGPDEGIEH